VIKRAAKEVLRAVAAAIGPHRWRRGPCLLVLTYHRVLPEGHLVRETEQPGMLVSPGFLAMHFEVLQRYLTPVHLDDWLRAAKAGDPPPGRSVAITFDDGWRDNYDFAFRVLKEAGMPATIFLVTDMVGSNYRFWPNRLAHTLKAWRPHFSQRLEENTRRRMIALGVPLDVPGADATPEWIDMVILRCKVADDAWMDALLDAIEAALPEIRASAALRWPEKNDQRDLLDWDEIRAMSETGLVRFGSHTRRHTRLRETLDPKTIEDEVAGSREILENRLGQPVPLFCYPNGDYSPRAYAAVAAAYEGAVSTQRGWNAAGLDPYAIRRIGLHGDVSGTSRSTLARLSGWRGL
jgi:peptidoglycan/xylan/chitin deacetylase (PgdA/CDA1 family)